MVKTAMLKARLRDATGKGVARKLRAAGRVPAVVYGHGDQSHALSLDAHELELLVAGISVDNTIVALDIEGEGQKDVLIRDVQSHPYKPEILHVDFIQVHAGEAIKLAVPVRLLGTPVGVHEEGGVLDQVRYDLEIECLPRNIPDVAEVDVSALRVGESIRIRDVDLPNVTILHDADLPVASVVIPGRKATAEPAEDEIEGEGEPELIRTTETVEEELEG